MSNQIKDGYKGLPIHNGDGSVSVVVLEKPTETPKCCNRKRVVIKVLLLGAIVGLTMKLSCRLRHRHHLHTDYLSGWDRGRSDHSHGGSSHGGRNHGGRRHGGSSHGGRHHSHGKPEIGEWNPSLVADGDNEWNEEGGSHKSHGGHSGHSHGRSRHGGRSHGGRHHSHGKPSFGDWNPSLSDEDSMKEWSKDQWSLYFTKGHGDHHDGRRGSHGHGGKHGDHGKHGHHHEQASSSSDSRSSSYDSTSSDVKPYVDVAVKVDLEEEFESSEAEDNSENLSE